MYQNIFTRILLAVLVLGVGTDIYLLLKHQAVPAAAKHASREAVPTRASLAAPSVELTGLPNFAALVAQNGPAVVNISVSGNAKVSSSPSSQNDPFANSSHHFQPSMPQNAMPTQVLERVKKSSPEYLLVYKIGDPISPFRHGLGTGESCFSMILIMET